MTQYFVSGGTLLVNSKILFLKKITVFLNYFQHNQVVSAPRESINVSVFPDPLRNVCNFACQIRRQIIIRSKSQYRKSRYKWLSTIPSYQRFLTVSSAGLLPLSPGLLRQPLHWSVSLCFSSSSASVCPVCGSVASCHSSVPDVPTLCPGFFQEDSQPRGPPFYSHLLRSLPPNGTAPSVPELAILFNSVPLLTLVPLPAIVSQLSLPVTTCPILLSLRNKTKCHLLQHSFPDTQPSSSQSFFDLEQHFLCCFTLTAQSSSVQLEGMSPQLSCKSFEGSVHV